MAVDITVRGPVGDDEVAYAQTKLGTIGRFVGGPVERASAVLTVNANPSMELPAEARAAIDVNGEVVRATAAAATLHEAIDVLEDRLQRRVDELGARREWRTSRATVRKAEGLPR